MAFNVLFAVAAYYNLDINQIDIKTAFLYGLIDQLVYVEVPKDFETQATKRMVCKLLKTLYDLKQTPRLWYEKLAKFVLEKLGLQQINAEHSILISLAGINGPIVSTFVDDIKIMGIKDSNVITQVNQKLTVVFKIADIGPINFYQGLKVTRDPEKKIFKLSQPAYIDKILAKFHLDKTKTLNMSMKEISLLSIKNKKAMAAKKKCYQKMTSFIIFSMIETSSNITYATLIVSCFAKNLLYLHHKMVMTIFCYLKATRDVRITCGEE